MSCRTTPYGSAFTTLARLRSGLSDVQTLSLYHSIRREDSDAQVEVDDAAWNARLDIAVRDTENDTNISDARRRSILNRLEASRETVPDNDTYRAIVLLEGRANAQADSLTSRLNEVASVTGEDLGVVRARFAAYTAEIDSSRSAGRPDGYTDENIRRFRADRLPVDRATVHAVTRLEQEARNAHAAANAVAPPRITRQRLNSSAVAEAGYDPRGGRLEVVMNSSDRVYTYRNVPADVWNRMQSGSAGNVFATQVRGNGLYQYRNQEEADAAGVATRCTGCGQFSIAGHVCPPAATTPPVTAPAPTVTPSTPTTDSATFGADILGDAFDDVTPDVDVEAEALGTSEPAAVVTPEREARPSVTLRRMYGRRRNHLTASAVAQLPTADRYDSFRIPSVTDIRSAARDNEVEFVVQYSGNRWRRADDDEATDGRFTAGHFNVHGTAMVRRDGREWTVQTRDLQCSCADYQRDYDCQHVRATADTIRAAVVPARTAAAAPVDPATAQRIAEEATRDDWTRQEELLAEARQTWAATDEMQNYSTNFQAFENDIKLAEERVAAGQEAVPYMRENALDGFCAEGSNEGFGIELEFDLAGMDYNQKAEAIRNIGQELYDTGLGVTPNQQRYHSTASTVHQQHERGWKFEQDCTVSGEIISPVMRDTPETWTNIEKVCEIVKRNGGSATVRTGSHVHVSAPNMSGSQAAALLNTVNQHEDVIYRLSSSPERGKHRNMTWCGPNRQISEGVTDLYQVRSAANGHNSGLNLQHVSGSGGDHPELRHWDGTLTPSIIQAQIKMSVGMVKAAERIQNVPAARRKEPVGAHYKRLQNVRGRSRRKLTSDELREDSATMRSFTDTLFKRPEDKAQIASLFAVTKWMTSR